MKAARIRPRPTKPDDPPPPAPQRIAPIRRPASWFRDELFYRDIVKSIISTGTVALIAYVYAVSAGYLATPSGKFQAFMVIFWTTVALAILAVAQTALGHTKRARALYLATFCGMVAVYVVQYTRRPYTFREITDLDADKFKLLLILATTAATLSATAVGLGIFIRNRKARQSSQEPTSPTME